MTLVLLAVVATFACPMLAHAGDVTASLGGGTVKLKGSAEADALTVSMPLPGQLLVTPGAGTTVNGSAMAQTFSDVTAVKVALADGADDLLVNGVSLEALTIATAKGADEVQVVNSAIVGTTKLDLGADNNVLELCNDVFASLAIKCGARSSELLAVVAECGGPAPFSTNTPIGSAMVLDDLQVTGTLSVKGGNGAQALAVIGADVGAAKLKLGKTSALAICDVTLNGNLDVSLGAGIEFVTSEIECPSGFVASGASAAVLDEVAIGGHLKLKTGKLGDEVTIARTAATAKTKIDLGAGDNFLGLIDSAFSADVSAKSGKGPDEYDIEDSAFGANVAIKTGAGNNELAGDGDAMSTSNTVSGDLTIKAGKDNDVIDVSDFAVGGAIDVDAGGGTNTVIVP